jgi:hypothetical protein
LDNLYEIFYRRSTATASEIEWFNANKPESWAAWETETPAADKPADQQQQQQQQQEQQPAPNPIPATFDVTKFNGFDLAVMSDEKASRIVADIAKLSKGLDDAAHETFTSERRRLIDSGVAIDAADATAKLLADKQRDEQRAKVYKAHEAKLRAAIQELKTAEKSAGDFAKIYNCIDRPVSETLLTLHGLGTAERQSYATQLAGANPGALRAAAELARATNNITLASALFIENGKLPREQRSFANDGLADHFYGKRATELHNAAAVTRSAVKLAELHLEELRTGRTTATATAKISLGLAQRRAAFKAPNPSPDEPLRTDDNLSKIRAGLNELANKA